MYLRADLAFRNPSPAAPEGFAVAWDELPDGQRVPWAAASAARRIDAPPRGEVGFAVAAASARADSLTNNPGAGAAVTIRDLHAGTAARVAFAAPAASIDRRTTDPQLDGRLDDWSGDAAIHAGPLVAFADRPSLRSGTPSLAGGRAEVYAGWTRLGLHLAFKVDGPPAGESATVNRTFVEEQARRLWGETACELIFAAGLPRPRRPERWAVAPPRAATQRQPVRPSEAATRGPLAPGSRSPPICGTRRGGRKMGRGGAN